MAWDRLVCCGVLPARTGGEIARSLMWAFSHAEKVSEELVTLDDV